MRIRRLALLAALVAMMVAPSIAAYHGGWAGTGMGEAPANLRPFNGAGAAHAANSYDAPIFRQFAFVNGTTTMYHVLTPESFLTDQHLSRIYQFPLCATLKPVLELHQSAPGDGGFQGAHDAPTRELVDVFLTSACTIQPTSEAQVLALAAPGGVLPRGLLVNAPIVPANLAGLPDDRLFSGPPFRPRIQGYQEGAPVKFLTYEVSWMPTWAATKFASGLDADVYMISYGATFRPGWTVINTAAGSPNTDTAPAYSPVWRANCIVDADNQKCNVSINQPAGYRQCYSVEECLSMVNPYTGKTVLQKRPNTFTHINCPMVAVDLNEDHYIDAWEDLLFPNLWANGPVLV